MCVSTLVPAHRQPTSDSVAPHNPTNQHPSFGLQMNDWWHNGPPDTFNKHYSGIGSFILHQL